jgi:DNA-binding beta-propeller fold protein YncE
MSATRNVLAHSLVLAVVGVAGFAASPSAAAASAGLPGPSGWRGRTLEMHAPWGGWRADGLPGRVPVGAGPQTATVDPATRTLYVTNGADRTVSVVNAAACNARRRAACGGAVATIAVGTSPVGVAVVASTRTVYVTNADDGTVSVIDASTCNARVTSGCAAAPATVAVGGVPLGLTVDDATHTVYVGNAEDFVSLIDAATCTGTSSAGCSRPPATVRVGPGPAGPAFDAVTRTLYVPDNGPGLDGSGSTMSLIDTRACNAEVTSGCGLPAITTTVGAGAASVLVDPDTQTVYVANQGDFTVSVVDRATCSARDVSGCGRTWPTVRVGAQPYAGLALQRASHTLFVLNNGSDTVSAVDVSHCNARDDSGCGQRAPTFQTGNAPAWIVLDPATDTLYVPNIIDDDVSVLDARSCNAQRTSGCRREAPTIFTDGVLGLAVDTDTHTLYVITAGRLALVDTRTCNASRLAGCGIEPAKVPLGTQGVGVQVDRGTHTVYVTDPVAGNLLVLDANTCNADRQSRCAPVATVALGGSPLSLALNPRTHTVYVGDIGQSTVEVLDGAHCSARDRSGCARAPLTLHTSPAPWAIAVDDGTDTVYVSLLQDDPTGTLAVLDGAACDAGSAACGPIAIAAGGVNPLGLTVDEATHTLYLAVNADEDAPGSVAVVDTRACRAGNTSGCSRTPTSVPAGLGTRVVVADPLTHTVFTGNFGDASASVIDGATCNGATVTGCSRTPPRVPVGNFPLAIALDPAHSTVYVGNAPDRTVSVIDARSPCRAPVRCLR